MFNYLKYLISIKFMSTLEACEFVHETCAKTVFKYGTESIRTGKDKNRWSIGMVNEHGSYTVIITTPWEELKDLEKQWHNLYEEEYRHNESLRDRLEKELIEQGRLNNMLERNYAYQQQTVKLLQSAKDCIGSFTDINEGVSRLIEVARTCSEAAQKMR